MQGVSRGREEGGPIGCRLQITKSPAGKGRLYFKSCATLLFNVNAPVAFVSADAPSCARLLPRSLPRTEICESHQGLADTGMVGVCRVWLTKACGDL